MELKEPTCEQCSANEKVAEDDHTVSYAIWYPQMGGYVGKAIATFAKGEGTEGCFDVLVWHDGEFPFRGEGGKQPCQLHHCAAGQFVDFGEAVAELQEATASTLAAGPVLRELHPNRN